MRTLVAASTHSTLRDRLIAAAEQVIARKGVGGLTLDAVAKHAKVSKGGLLYHFPSKKKLVLAITERLASECDSKHAASCDDDANKPGRFTRAYVKARVNPPDPKQEPIHTALLAAVATDPDYIESFRSRKCKWDEQLLSDGIDPVTAMIVRLAIDGFCLSALLRLPVPQGDLRVKIIDRLLSMTEKKEVRK